MAIPSYWDPDWKSPGEEALEEIRSLRQLEQKYLRDMIDTFAMYDRLLDARWERVRRRWASKHDRAIPSMPGGY